MFKCLCLHFKFDLYALFQYIILYRSPAQISVQDQFYRGKKRIFYLTRTMSYEQQNIELALTYI